MTYILHHKTAGPILLRNAKKTVYKKDDKEDDRFLQFNLYAGGTLLVERSAILSIKASNE